MPITAGSYLQRPGEYWEGKKSLPSRWTENCVSGLHLITTIIIEIHKNRQDFFEIWASSHSPHDKRQLSKEDITHKFSINCMIQFSVVRTFINTGFQFQQFWSWEKKQKLLHLPTQVTRENTRRIKFSASRSDPHNFFYHYQLSESSNLVLLICEYHHFPFFKFSKMFGEKRTVSEPFWFPLSDSLRFFGPPWKQRQISSSLSPYFSEKQLNYFVHAHNTHFTKKAVLFPSHTFVSLLCGHFFFFVADQAIRSSSQIWVWLLPNNPAGCNCFQSRLHSQSKEFKMSRL